MRGKKMKKVDWIDQISETLCLWQISGIYNSTTQKADRVGIRVNDKGEKERFFKSNGETVLW